MGGAALGVVQGVAGGAAAVMAGGSAYVFRGKGGEGEGVKEEDESKVSEGDASAEDGAGKVLPKL